MGYTLEQLRSAWGAGKHAAEKELADNAILIGKYFHGGNWQGKVLSEVSPQMYMVQLYEWIMGEAIARKVVSIDDMSAWTFYSRHDEWLKAGDVIIEKSLRSHQVQP